MGEGKGRVEFVALNQSWSDQVHGGFSAQHRFVDLLAPEPKTALNETWEVKVYNLPDGAKPMWVFDLTSTQTCASASALKLPKYHYGGLGFRHVVRYVGFVEQHLPLEVTRFDEVAVDDADMPDSRTHEIISEDRTERADSAERHAAIHDAFLARFADTGDAHLTGISFESVVHVRRGIATLLRFR